VNAEQIALHPVPPETTRYFKEPLSLARARLPDRLVRRTAWLFSKVEEDMECGGMVVNYHSSGVYLTTPYFPRQVTDTYNHVFYTFVKIPKQLRTGK
jgi:hypothetical protein